MLSSSCYTANDSDQILGDATLFLSRLEVVQHHFVVYIAAVEQDEIVACKVSILEDCGILGNKVLKALRRGVKSGFFLKLATW